jgi:alkylation response protein AidB-like acyl-CoA dehydrogenase
VTTTHSSSAEHTLLRDTVRQLLTRYAPDHDVARWDAAETFPDEVYRRIAELGLCGLSFGEQHGGTGPDYHALCLVVEELARTSGALTWAYLSTVSVTARAIANFGTERQRTHLLPRIADGSLRVSIALTEPDAGSDLAALSTSAEPDADGLIVNGQKVFTTGADSAGELMTLVRTSPGSDMRSALTFVLIPPTTPGVTIRPLPKMAGQSLHTCEVFFDSVRVPRDAVVGEVGGASAILFSALDGERVATAAMGLGIASGALDKAAAYALQRKQFSTPIAEKQAIAHLLADMAIDVDTARLLTERAADLLQRGLPCARESAIAKVAATEIGTRCANRGMQILGGYSYMVEYGMERYWRESKLYEIAAGTNQILRDHIARDLRVQYRKASQSRRARKELECTTAPNPIASATTGSGVELTRHEHDAGRDQT